MYEKKIRELFAEARDADRKRAPGFAAIYTRLRSADSHSPTARLRPMILGAAAAGLIAVAWLARDRSVSPSLMTPTIASWQAPTDVLLHTPGSELFGAMPPLGASVLDALLPTSANKGDPQ